MKTRTIVFVHGMYMNSLCWEHWVAHFRSKGYNCIAPDWPGRDQPIAVLRNNHPDAALGQLTLSQVVEHYAKLIKTLDEKPVIIGHSMGGLVVQCLLQKDLAAAAIAVDSAPPMGVFSTKWSFVKANWPHITPFASIGSPVEISFERFQYAFTNGMSLAEQRAAYDRYIVPESRRVPRESLTTRIAFKKPHAPLLFVAGSSDHIIPASLNRANQKKYRHAESVTDYQAFAGRNHFIVGQNNWEEVADYVLAWLAKNDVSVQVD